MFQIGDMIMVSNGETNAEYYGFIIGYEPLDLFDDPGDNGEDEYKIQWFDGKISYENESDLLKVS